LHMGANKAGANCACRCRTWRTQADYELPDGGACTVPGWCSLSRRLKPMPPQGSPLP
jgi:hypothetical protein